MKHGVRDYWAFVEKIQDATDYVQELLTENQRLRARNAELERQKAALAQQLGDLRGLLQRQQCEDPLPHAQPGKNGQHPTRRLRPLRQTPSPVAAPPLKLAPQVV